MPRYELRVGGHIDVLDKNELDDVIDKQTRMLLDEAKGVSHIDFYATGTVVGAAVTIPSPNPASIGQLQIPDLGPEDGYVWSLQRLTIDGLGTGDSVVIYKNFVSGPNHLFTLRVAQEWIFPGSHAGILKGGDVIIAVGSGLTATGQLTLSGEALEAPAVKIYKLIGGN